MTTIRNVAELAGVSTATVSRVLSLDSTLSVSNETRERIFAIAEELNYKPRMKNRMKPNAHTAKVGLVLCTAEHEEAPYWQSIRQGIEKECQNLGVFYMMLLWNDKELTIQNRGDIEQLDGIIAISEREGTASYLSHLALPIVFVDPHSRMVQSDSVGIDFEAATSSAIHHLIELGHQHIGFIGGNRLTGRDPRYLTYERILQEKKLFHQDHIYFGSWAANDGYALMKQAIERGNLPTAFFLASDLLALGALHALHESGMKVPDDLSLVSFDGTEISAFTQPPMTTVKVYVEMMGTVATRLMMERIQGRDIALTVTVATTLLVRGSSGPVPTR